MVTTQCPIGQFWDTVFRRICHVTSITTRQKCMHRNFQHMLSKRVKKFYFILHKIFGKFKSKRLVTLPQSYGNHDYVLTEH